MSAIAARSAPEASRVSKLVPGRPGVSPGGLGRWWRSVPVEGSSPVSGRRGGTRTRMALSQPFLRRPRLPFRHPPIRVFLRLRSCRSNLTYPAQVGKVPLERPVTLTQRHLILMQALCTQRLDQLGEDLPAAQLRQARVDLAGMEDALLRALIDRIDDEVIDRFRAADDVTD